MATISGVRCLFCQTVFPGFTVAASISLELSAEVVKKVKDVNIQEICCCDGEDICPNCGSTTIVRVETRKDT